jgi:polar amino acid transport system substrate-binding protein
MRCSGWFSGDIGLIRSWSTAVCSALAVGLALQVATPLFAKAHCPKSIEISWEEAKPFQFEESGKVTGSDMDVFDLVMKKMGCAYKAEKTPWERTLMEIENGTSLFAAGATITEARKKFAYFTDPYDVEKIFPYVLKQRLASMKVGSVGEILAAGYKLVITSGSTYGDDFDELVKSGKLVKGKNLFEVASEKQAGEMIALGRADVFVASGAGLTFHGDLVDGKAPMFTTETRFMISKKASNEAFLKQVNGAIADLSRDGSLKRVKNKYFPK